MSDFIELKNQLSELHGTIAALTAERDEWKAIAQSYDGCLEGIALKLERKKVAGLVLENRAYDLRMDNDGKRIVELEAELATVKESLTTAEATIDKLRDAIKGVGQFDVTGYCHMCDEYKMHNEECPHTVSALAAKGGE